MTKNNISLSIIGLGHYFGEGESRKQVLYDNDLEIGRGEIVILTGPSGSGKTTLLTLIGGLRSVQEGSLVLFGNELKGLDKNSQIDIRKNIGFIFQAHNLFMSLTARQNVNMALELKDLPKQEMNDRSDAILSKIGLEERLLYKPQKLSGGQRQRVAIARALVNKPKLILADEPTAALDEKTGRIVVDLLKDMAKNDGSMIMIVTHDNRILDCADRIINMVDGRIISNILIKEELATLDFLKRCNTFSDLSTSELTGVTRKFDKHKFSKGEYIVKQGDAGDYFYLIWQGTVDIYINDGKGDKKVSSMGEGDSFGETALLTGEPRNASVMASIDTVCLALNKESFDEAIAKSPTFSEEVKSIIFQRQ